MAEAPVRVHPFSLLFEQFKADRFPAIAAELDGRTGDDAFRLSAAAVELMQELRPEEGFGEAIDEMVALVHAAFSFWRDGEITVVLDPDATHSLCAPHFARSPSSTDTTSSRSGKTKYVQIAPFMVWAQLTADAAFEPLDGWFAAATDGQLHLVACFGMHPGRPGISVAAVNGFRPSLDTRPDGSPLFAPTMPGGDVAGLYAVASPEELLLLGLREMIGEEQA